MKGEQEVLEAFSAVRSFVRGDERAPHKPFVLLLALAAVQQDKRWLPFRDLEPRFRKVFQAFGPQKTAARAEYPFWRLQQDGIWIIPGAPSLTPLENASGDVSVTELRKRNAVGGFPDDLYAAFRAQPSLIHAVAAQLLTNSFPISIHEEILDAIGLEWTVSIRRRRDPRFREEILRIYERQCAVCRYDGRLGTFDLGLEAAHIKWHAAGGPDSLDNGLALCSFHHVALDRGALAIDDELKLQVSQDVLGKNQVGSLLLQYAGKALLRPQSGNPTPNPLYLGWHRDQVFRSPARVVI